MMLAQAQPEILVSLFKPLLLVAIILPWAFVITKLDKDADFFYLKREMFSVIYIVSGLLALAAALLIPIFWIGLPVAILVLIGSIAGYVLYRNPQVPPAEKFEFSMDWLKTFMLERDKKKANQGASVRILKMDESEVDVPSGDDPNVAAHQLFEQILDWTLPRNADQINLTISGDAETIKLSTVVDGVKFEQESMGLEPIGRQEGFQLLKYLQKCSGLDETEKRKKQLGKFKIAASVPDSLSGTPQDERHLVEVATSGSSRAMQAILEMDPDARAHRTIEHLGLTRKQLAKIKEAINDRAGGVFLIATPPKQGLSTVIYSMVNEHDPYVASILTLEENLLLELEGVKHESFNPGDGQEEYHRRMAGMLRTDPQVIMVDRMPESDTAGLMAENAEEVRFYVPVQAGSASDALAIWVKAVGDKNLAAKNLAGVVSGRLIRKLCPTCRTAYKPDAAALKKMNLPADKIDELYRSSGQVVDNRGKPMTCPACHGMGYSGRTGVYEVLLLDDEARRLLAADDHARLKSHLGKLGFIPLQRGALAKVAEGETDVSEIQRALGKPSSPGKPAASTKKSSAGKASGKRSGKDAKGSSSKSDRKKP